MEWINRFLSAWEGWALSASWQLAILVALIALVAFSARRFSPRWRYALWLLVIVKVFLPPSLALIWGIGNWGIGPIQGRIRDIAPVMTRPAQAPALQQPGVPVNKEAPFQSALIAPGQETSAEKGPYSRQYAPLTQAAVESEATSFFTRFLFMGWLLGLAGFLGFVLFRYIRLSRSLRHAEAIDEGPLRVDLERLALDMGKENPPELILSDRVTSPFLCGLFHPRIVLPNHLPEALSPDELRHVLLHELMHWKRRDVYVGWIQLLAQALFWFHPFLWLANARVRHERECACDEEAINLGKCPPKGYGEALLKVLLAAEGRSAAGLGFLGIFERDTRIQNRLEEIMSYGPKPRTFGLVHWIFIVLFALVLLPMAGVRKAATGETSGTSEQDFAREAGAEQDVKLVRLSYVDDTAEGKRSLGASGHAVFFDRPEEVSYIEAVEIFSSRYGMPEPPKENFHLYILNEDRKALADLEYPYGMIERADMRWYRLETMSVEAPKQFFVALSFNPHRTKGIYLGYDESVTESHSLKGLPDSGYEELSDSWDWMVRVYLSETPSGKRGVRRLEDWIPAEKSDPFVDLLEVAYDSGETDGRQSYGGRGPAIRILPSDSGAPSETLLLKGVRVYASRYGSGYPPETTYVYVSVIDAGNNVLGRFSFPYKEFSYKVKWVDFILSDPLRVNANEPLIIAFDPEAHQTKGIYFHYNKDPRDSHSLAGKKEQGFQDIPEREWMIRAYFQEPGSYAASPSSDMRENRPPKIRLTFPRVGATDVDPSITEIAVTFDSDMKTDGYSWTGGGPQFPPLPEGKSVYWKDSRTCALPVQLETGRYYRVGINSTSYQNFRSARGVPVDPSVIYFTTQGGGEYLSQKLQKAEVVDLYPANGATKVNPNIKEILATFSIPMGAGYSFTGGGEHFPTLIEGMNPYWTNDNKTCVLPVELKPNWSYRLGLNSPSHKNFQSADGVPLDPLAYSFTTGE